MRYVNLDASRMTDVETVHQYIAEQFGIRPYGSSLDDMLLTLVSLKYEYLVKIKNAEMLDIYLGEYGKVLIDVLGIARDINRLLHIRFLWEIDKTRLY
ncbi:MAG: barstar family protein [Lachnospiraceae bacterium]|nr:barstar family protein [Lachnospiraceae bacterium]